MQLGRITQICATRLRQTVTSVVSFAAVSDLQDQVVSFMEDGIGLGGS
jgi:hypothetical protein